MPWRPQEVPGTRCIPRYAHADNDKSATMDGDWDEVSTGAHPALLPPQVLSISDPHEPPDLAMDGLIPCLCRYNFIHGTLLTI